MLTLEKLFNQLEPQLWLVKERLYIIAFLFQLKHSAYSGGQRREPQVGKLVWGNVDGHLCS